MDSSSFSTGGKRSPSQIQGPRPPPLSISKDSHKIKKPPKVPASDAANNRRNNQPVIIYAVSPKIIHATADDFMTTVQRLTGFSSEDESCTAGGLSPAARLASIEKAISPKEKGGAVSARADEGEERAEVDRAPPGILSPATLPPVIEDMYFSPVSQNNNLAGFSYNGLLGNSPTGLLSARLLGSPVLSPDFFAQIWNF